MGLLENIFRKNKHPTQFVGDYFKTMSAYTPVFTSRDGGVYEMDLTRMCIHNFAEHISKLIPKIKGDESEKYKILGSKIARKPNEYMTTSQFLYKVATLYEAHNNVFIIPIENRYGELEGYYPIAPTSCEIVEQNQTLFLRYSFRNGQRASIEYNKVGILRKFYYEDDFFGSDNKPLGTTLNVIHANKQGLMNAIKTSAIIQFIGRIANQIKDEDLTKKRDKFAKDNLSSDNTSGLLLYDSTFADLKQIEYKQYTIDAEQEENIKNNVYSYFGTNEKVLQNKYSEDEFKSYYEGKIEPFMNQLSQVLVNMTFTDAEVENGLSIILSDNKLEFASGTLKLDMCTQFLDRGVFTRNDVRDMWDLPHVEGGDKFLIRLEYAEVSNLSKPPTEEEKKGGTED